MHDHLHALVEATAPECDFGRLASMFKQRSAFAHKLATGEGLWQESYFDRVLRGDESTLDVVAYILDNPVKAGYCQDPHVARPFQGHGLRFRSLLSAPAQSFLAAAIDFRTK